MPGAVRGYTIVRLPMEVSTLFQDWLEHHFPGRKEKVLERIRRCETVVSTILASE